MTPFAMRLVKGLYEPALSAKLYDPLTKAWGQNRELLSSLLLDIHCFECTAVRELLNEAMRDSVDRGDFNLVDAVLFLPAEKTWIEYQAEGRRFAFLLINIFDDTARLYVFTESENVGIYVGIIGLKGFAHVDYYSTSNDALKSFLVEIYALLSAINTPRVIGRRQHMPHRGLEKRLSKLRRRMGAFPLHAWTEIKLEISQTPEDMALTGSQEAHLTGERAYHFCRAHLRIRWGRLEFVRAHWRGNPSLGIKQSRYALLPPKGGA